MFNDTKIGNLYAIVDIRNEEYCFGILIDQFAIFKEAIFFVNKNYYLIDYPFYEIYEIDYNDDQNEFDLEIYKYNFKHSFDFLKGLETWKKKQNLS